MLEKNVSLSNSKLFFFKLYKIHLILQVKVLLYALHKYTVDINKFICILQTIGWLTAVLNNDKGSCNETNQEYLNFKHEL